MYDIQTLSSFAFGGAAGQEQDAAPVTARADVALGGRPSCMAVSGDNLRVAVALGDKVGTVPSRLGPHGWCTVLLVLFCFAA